MQPDTSPADEQRPIPTQHRSFDTHEAAGKFRNAELQKFQGFPSSSCSVDCVFAAHNQMRPAYLDCGHSHTTPETKSAQSHVDVVPKLTPTLDTQLDTQEVDGTIYASYLFSTFTNLERLHSAPSEAQFRSNLHLKHWLGAASSYLLPFPSNALLLGHPTTQLSNRVQRPAGASESISSLRLRIGSAVGQHHDFSRSFHFQQR